MSLFGGIDNDIKVWDMRRKAVVYSMLETQTTISSLSHITRFPNRFSQIPWTRTLRTWDIRPFAPTERHIRTLMGHLAGMEKELDQGYLELQMERELLQELVMVLLSFWNSETGKLLYKLPGHTGDG